MRHPPVQSETREPEDHPDLPFLHRYGGCGESQPENDRQDSTKIKTTGKCSTNFDAV